MINSSNHVALGPLDVAFGPLKVEEFLVDPGQQPSPTLSAELRAALLGPPSECLGPEPTLPVVDDAAGVLGPNPSPTLLPLGAASLLDDMKTSHADVRWW
ncbi:unnamed protein product [Linum trigynum]|uniref:Uncharacterized protein n=1 Tax=Linum trigynum TaxID=586398 RepID=A0AAV2GMD3_9ROSI